VSLLTELDAFYLDHRRCGELEAGVEGRSPGLRVSAGRRACGGSTRTSGVRIEIQTTVSPTPWREQYQRMRRWRQRMAAGTESNPSYLLDNIHAFFIACFHLRDWLVADASVAREIGDAAKRLVNTDYSLQICADIANGLKHLVLTRSVRHDPPVSMSTAEPATIYDASGVELGEATVVADGCLKSWDTLLKAHGLLS
jgi:hypothetical protein